MTLIQFCSRRQNSPPTARPALFLTSQSTHSASQSPSPEPSKPRTPDPQPTHIKLASSSQAAPKSRPQRPTRTSSCSRQAACSTARRAQPKPALLCTSPTLVLLHPSSPTCWLRWRICSYLHASTPTARTSGPSFSQQTCSRLMSHQRRTWPASGTRTGPSPASAHHRCKMWTGEASNASILASWQAGTGSAGQTQWCVQQAARPWLWAPGCSMCTCLLASECVAEPVRCCRAQVVGPCPAEGQAVRCCCCARSCSHNIALLAPTVTVTASSVQCVCGWR